MREQIGVPLGPKEGRMGVAGGVRDVIEGFLEVVPRVQGGDLKPRDELGLEGLRGEGEAIDEFVNFSLHDGQRVHKLTHLMGQSPFLLLFEETPIGVQPC